MKSIAILIDNIYEEIEDASKYADLAISAEGSVRNLYLNLSAEELGHADRLHKVAADMISKAKDSGTAIPTGMAEMYQLEHKRIIDKVCMIRHKLDMANDE